MASYDYIKSFGSFGINLYDSGDGVNYHSDCPFSGSSGKFYVNKDTGLWDSKTAGMSGNLYTFFKEFYALCKEHEQDHTYDVLISKKGLTKEAFKDCGIVRNPLNDDYLIPSYNSEGTIVDLGKWNTRKNFVARTKHTKVSLNGVELLAHSTIDVPVYICEGEWDMIALRYTLKKIDIDAVVVCVPGAGTFKDEWIELFKNRKVHLCYDNDRAGELGEIKTGNRLKGVADSIKFLAWDDIHPDKYDVRDFISFHGLDYGKCIDNMAHMMSDYNRVDRINPVASGIIPPTINSEPPPTIKELEDGFARYLHIDNFDPYAFMFGVCFANRIDDDPVWAFLVAPPAGSKTAMLEPLSGSTSVLTASTLTPASLISGTALAGGVDPSLLAKLNGKMLSIKDFTSILSLHPNSRDEIFAILREAYDGKVEKHFGRGQHRVYDDLKFGIIAGVTPTIDRFQKLHSSLGERFLKYRLDDNLLVDVEEARCMMGMRRSGLSQDRKKELMKLCARMLNKKIPDHENLPQASDSILKRIISYARYTARLRSSIQRNGYTREMETLPIKEIAVRLAKQYYTLAQGIAIYYDHDDIGEDEMRILKKVSIDTAPQMVQETVQSVHKRTIASPVSIASARDIESDVGICFTTASNLLEDLYYMKILKKVEVGTVVKYAYRLHDDMESIINIGSIYQPASSSI